MRAKMAVMNQTNKLSPHPRKSSKMLLKLSVFKPRCNPPCNNQRCRILKSNKLNQPTKRMLILMEMTLSMRYSKAPLMRMINVV